MKIAIKIEISAGSNKYYGQTYDISQGGLSFVVSEPIELGAAIIRVSNETFVIEGKILASHVFGNSEMPRFHFQFDAALELATLAGIMGS